MKCPQNRGRTLESLYPDGSSEEGSQGSFSVTFKDGEILNLEHDISDLVEVTVNAYDGPLNSGNLDKILSLTVENVMDLRAKGNYGVNAAVNSLLDEGPISEIGLKVNP